MTIEIPEIVKQTNLSLKRMRKNAAPLSFRAMPKITTYSIIAILCLIFAACSEQRNDFFINGIEAQRSVAAKGGWIPAWFPTQATEIHIQYDLDTNYRWFRFKLEKASKDVFIRNFKLLSWDQAQNVRYSSPGSAKWWFHGLIQSQPANDAALNADIYVGNDITIPKKAYLAISMTDDLIYLWIER
jgi:hypothetical protein